MDLIFCFFFCEPNTERVLRSLTFYATNINTTWDKLGEAMVRHTETMSAQYGEQSGLRFENINMIVYNSVDINPQQHDLVMAAWRQVFANDLTDCVVGEVCDVTNVGTYGEIYDYTKQAYEAQQLRAALATHITAPNTVAPPKKI